MQHSEVEPSITSDPSRPGTPDSQLTNSLYRATVTIDDLTTTLTKVSRAPTPDDLNLLHCCCGRSECENSKAWSAFQSKLESRLIFCAEIGQALLEKHEAYVRRHGGLLNDDDESDNESRYTIPSRPDTPTAKLPHLSSPDSQIEARVTQLVKENVSLEKRLNTALLHSEVAESANKTLVKELEDSKETISRLNLSQAKSTGWETRLSMALQDSEDLRQELDSERQRSKALDAQLSAVKERCIKLQIELKQVNDELEDQRQTRRELAEEILRDARARLEMIQQTQLGRTISPESPEVTQVMESLVADNEALKRDIAELQNLLAESREDVRTLQDELEESKAQAPSGLEEKSKVFSSPFKPGHRGHISSWASSFGQTPLSPLWNTMNDASRGQSRSATPSIAPKHPYEPLTPSTEQRPLSPTDSNLQLERHMPSLTSPLPNYPPSHLSVDVENKILRAKTPETPERKSPRRPLLLLTHNQAVQTDAINWANLLSPSPYARSQGLDDSSCATPPNEGRSESSSFVEGQPHSSTIAVLVDRANSLFTRISQADARTLTNRLRRQHLAGDVAHLSRATVSAILAEVNSLRAHFRSVLEDEKVISTCTRRDFRALLSLFKEMFSELGQMRITLNDVILDPTVAPKVSAAAMEDSKDAEEARAKVSSRGTSSLGGWIAPISKLFGTSTTTPLDKGSSTLSVPTPRSAAGTTSSSMVTRQKPARFIPKIAPALGASTTTVNVEFSGSGVGRSVSSALTTSSGTEQAVIRATTPVPSPAGPSRTVMDIFAGAPRPPEGDSWIVVSPKPQRRLRGTPSTSNLGVATMSRTAGRRMVSNRLSRNVDAVIDSESAVHESDDEDEDHNLQDRLLERTLRPRGLSDSSIRSTFLAGEENDQVSSLAKTSMVTNPLPAHATLVGGRSTRQGAYPGQSSRASVLHAFNKTVQAFKSPPPSAPPSEMSTSPTSPRRINILPSLAGWAAAQAGLDAEATESFVGSVREDEMHFGHRKWKVDMQGRDI